MRRRVAQVAAASRHRRQPDLRGQPHRVNRKRILVGSSGLLEVVARRRRREERVTISCAGSGDASANRRALHSSGTTSPTTASWNVRSAGSVDAAVTHSAADRSSAAV